MEGLVTCVHDERRALVGNADRGAEGPSTLDQCLGQLEVGVWLRLFPRRARQRKAWQQDAPERVKEPSAGDVVVCGGFSQNTRVCLIRVLLLYSL